MLVRVASRGAHEGERFWGCPDYPRCRGVRAYGQAGEG
jgi:restriction system protein